jgi:uncharacterized protein
VDNAGRPWNISACHSHCLDLSGQAWIDPPRSLNPRVQGSSPWGRTTKSPCQSPFPSLDEFVFRHHPARFTSRFTFCQTISAANSRGLVALIRDNGFVMTLETLRERRAEVLEIARRRGAKAVWVFGSVARGEATPASDIDFLVEFEPGRSLLDQVHLIDELGSLLGTPVEVVAKGGLLERDHHILAEAVPL